MRTNGPFRRVQIDLKPDLARRLEIAADSTHVPMTGYVRRAASPLLPGVRLTGNSKDELDRQIAELTASGAIRSNTPVICRLGTG